MLKYICKYLDFTYYFDDFSKYISSRKIRCITNHFFTFEEMIEVELLLREGNTFLLNFNNEEIKFETDNKIFKEGVFIVYILCNISITEVSNKLPLLYFVIHSIYKIYTNFSKFQSRKIKKSFINC